MVFQAATATTSTTATTTATATPQRPATPTYEGEVFSDDHISPTPPLNYLHGVNYSRPQSTMGDSSGANQPTGSSYFRSRRVRKGEVEKPWTKKKDPKEKWVTIIPLLGIGLGLAFAGFLVYDGLKTVVNNTYSLVLDEDFSGGLNSKIWTKEVEVGGYGYVHLGLFHQAGLLN